MMNWFKRLLRQERRHGEATSITDGHGLDAKAYFKQGVEFGQARQDKEALEAFETAVRLSPDFAQAHFNRAIALRSLNRLEEAMAAYEEVIRLKPGEASAAALFEQGEVLTKLGRWEEAAAAFDRLLALHPDYVPALERRSPILGILGRFEDAARDRERARRIRDQQSGSPAKEPLIMQHFDLRSEDYRRMEKEVAEGIPSSSQSLDVLCEELVRVVQESHNWAREHGFPRVADYPQYRRIRQLGEQIHEIAGYRGMQRACMVLKAKCHTRDGGGKSWPAEKAWEGIGGWMP